MTTLQNTEQFFEALYILFDLGTITATCCHLRISQKKCHVRQWSVTGSKPKTYWGKDLCTRLHVVLSVVPSQIVRQFIDNYSQMVFRHGRYQEKVHSNKHRLK